MSHRGPNGTFRDVRIPVPIRCKADLEQTTLKKSDLCVRALIFPKTFEPIWRQGRVSCRVLDVAVAEVGTRLP
jgi:hypothetical protein